MYTLQFSLEVGYRALNCLRKRCIPLVLAGGRDMVLLESGWVDNVGIPEDFVKARYDSDKNHITMGTEPLKRWKWIAAATPQVDMTEFCNSLRTNVSINDSEIILLFAHQTGKIPSSPLSVTFRDGSEGKVEFRL